MKPVEVDRGMRYTSRFLERKDLLDFLSGALLGFALDEYFEGAYMGAFDEAGRPAGFIFTGSPRPDGTILIGVPHAVKDGAASQELEEHLVRSALENASARGLAATAAVYSDQAQEEILRLQGIYRCLGLRYLRDSTILGRRLDEVEAFPHIVTIGIEESGLETIASVASECAADSGWSDVDFHGRIGEWRNGQSFDPELFRLATVDGVPAGVCLARLDSLDRKEGAFYFIGTRPQFRRRGLGRSLLLAGLAGLKERGAEKTRQMVPAGEGASLRLLESAGYRVLEWARFFATGEGRPCPET